MSFICHRKESVCVSVVVCVCVCACHLVTLGTLLMTELQSESRPIFATQPVMSRKNRKTALSAMMTLIHVRCLCGG